MQTARILRPSASLARIVRPFFLGGRSDRTFPFLSADNLYRSGLPDEAVKVATAGFNGALAHWIRQQQIVAEEATQVRKGSKPSRAVPGAGAGIGRIARAMLAAMHAAQIDAAPPTSGPNSPVCVLAIKFRKREAAAACQRAAHRPIVGCTCREPV